MPTSSPPTSSTPTSITHVRARQILDSRGRPTVEADIRLADGSLGRASVPSGASTGRHEAAELRDRDPAAFEGLGVLNAVAHVNTLIAAHLTGRDAADQPALDAALRALDPSPRLHTIGANAVLAASLAAARAAAIARGLPLHLHVAAMAGRPPSMPMPMVNILSGGAHAGRSMDIQDFLAIPVGAQSYPQALAWIVRVRAQAAHIVAERGGATLLADEGGLAPGYRDPRHALDVMVAAIERAGLRPGADIAIALDVAASELFDGARYQLRGAGLTLTGAELVGYIAALVAAYPIVSVEDPLDQDDWTGWAAATASLGHIQLVGDDLFVTQEQRIAMGIDRQVANAALIKPNQNGTLTGTLAAIRTAKAAGYATVVSARSGETEDAFLADLAVGAGGGQIKIGSVRNAERMAKYNQLLRLDEAATLPFAPFAVPTPHRPAHPLPAEPRPPPTAALAS